MSLHSTRETSEGEQVQAQAMAPDVVYALAKAPGLARSGLCFAARQSGLYRSEDEGRTWRPGLGSLNFGEPVSSTAVALSPDFEADRCVFAGLPGALVRSNDGGLSWQIAGLPTPTPSISSLVVSPAFGQDGRLAAGTLDDGVFLSEDGGRNWVPWNFGLLDYHILCLAISPDFARDRTLYAGTQSGIFRSPNGGRSWRELDFPAAWAPVLSLAVSPDHARDNLLYAGTESSGLFVSKDRGRHWDRLGETTIADPVNAILLAPGFPEEGSLLALLPEAVWVSHDLGQTWQARHTELDLQAGATCALALGGLDAAAPLLLGMADGQILRLTTSPSR
jgi:photosystem II stability/assembly factor-like uncharacterized protein